MSDLWLGKAPEILAYELARTEARVTELEAERDDYKLAAAAEAQLFNEAGARVAELEAALRAIRGPEDRGPWIAVYQAAGGGYEGLQAIAAAALSGEPKP